MSNWSERQERRNEEKEKRKVRREKLSGYFFDLSKLTFAALVVGILVSINADENLVIDIVRAVLGIIATIVLARFANKILK